jgi:hypothetical protein
MSEAIRIPLCVKKRLYLRAKMEDMVRAWLKKWTPKRSARDKKERPVEAV